MATQIIINGKEVTNPVTKAFLIIGAIIVAAFVTAFVIFVLLPIIGVAVTLSVGFIVIFIVATVVSIATLGFITIILSWFIGSTEFKIEKNHKRSNRD
ncbi:MAG: hypothetical protein QM484_04560 [Woeseiaceae bacterium]